MIELYYVDNFDKQKRSDQQFFGKNISNCVEYGCLTMNIMNHE